MSDSLPRLLLGMVIAIYWGRVIKMAQRARRNGRTAHLVPPELLGRSLRLIWVPVIAIWAATPFLSAIWPRLPSLMRPLWNSAATSWCGSTAAALCLAGSVLCWRRMGRNWRMGIDPAELTPLITTGPYSLSRHPIYTLSQIMMLATLLATPTPLLIIAGLIHISLLQWEARREERHMLRVHGTVYESYRAHVGRFIPRP